LNKVINGRYVPLSTLDSNDTRQSAVGWAVLIVFWVSAVFFLRWFSRAYKNLIPLGADGLRFGPGWAIGAWFVPVLGLWRPKQMANDIWRASDPDDPELLFWHEKQVPALLTAWWAAWIIVGQIGFVILRSAFTTDPPEKLRTGDRIDLAFLVADIATCVLAILVVRSITALEVPGMGVPGAGLGSGGAARSMVQPPVLRTNARLCLLGLCRGGEEVDKQLVDAFRLVVVHPVRRVR